MLMLDTIIPSMILIIEPIILGMSMTPETIISTGTWLDPDA
jgi:hypothetical protein